MNGRRSLSTLEVCADLDSPTAPKTTYKKRARVKSTQQTTSVHFLKKHKVVRTRMKITAQKHTVPRKKMRSRAGAHLVVDQLKGECDCEVEGKGG